MRGRVLHRHHAGRVHQDGVVDDDDLDRARDQLAAEQGFIDERGGSRWIETYIKPYCRKWMGLGAATRAEVPTLIPQVRERAFELRSEDISAMVRMQWRIQVMGTWFAVARADKRFMDPVHDGFDACYGTLTAPALATAVLTYPNETTSRVLRAYRDRDNARRYGASGIITAALRHLDPEGTEPGDPRDDEALEGLLDVARQLQRRA